MSKAVIDSFLTLVLHEKSDKSCNLASLFDRICKREGVPMRIFMYQAGTQPEIFLGKGGFVKLGQEKKKVKKKDPAGKIFRVFSLTLKTTFWMENLA